MESYQLNLNLGLVCINTILREQKPAIFCSRTCIRRTFTVDKAKSLALQNVRDIYKMIQWNHENGIKCFRLSSDMFPHFTDPECTSYDIDFAEYDLKRAGDLANLYGHRIVMHPSQFNQIAGNDDVFAKTIADLEHHCHILNLMGIDKLNGVIIVHGGGTYGNRDQTIKKWITNFHRLPQCIKDRLVIENCESAYNIDHCLYIAKQCQIPVVYDLHHYECWKLQKLLPEQSPIEEVFPEIIASWSYGHRVDTDNVRILMHISEQASGKRMGAHSDYITVIPEFLFNLIMKYDVKVDLEIEAKMKEQAIFRLYQKYPFLNTKNGSSNQIHTLPIQNTTPKIKLKLNFKEKINNIQIIKIDIN